MKKNLLKVIAFVLSFVAGASMASFRSTRPVIAYKNCEMPAVTQNVPPSVAPVLISKEVRDAAAAFPRYETENPSGSLTWSGTVNGMGNVVLRGESASYQSIVGYGVTDFGYVISSRIPSRAMQVRMEVKTGRARIIQSPAPTNGYVTIVQVEGQQQPISFTLHWSVL